MFTLILHGSRIVCAQGRKFQISLKRSNFVVDFVFTRGSSWQRFLSHGFTPTFYKTIMSMMNVWVKEAIALGFMVGREVARLFHWCSFCVKIHNERRRASLVHIIGGGVDHKGFGSMAYFSCLGGDSTFFCGSHGQKWYIWKACKYNFIVSRSSQVGWT